MRRYTLIGLIYASLMALSMSATAKNTTTSFGSNAKVGKYIEVNDVKLYYETYGKGEPLLLLHGNAGSILGFEFQIPELSRHFKVIAVDSRAQGKSTDSDKELTFTLLASDMSELIKKLNLKSVFILGQSDGGIIGLELALAHPQQVKKLVAVGANYTWQNYEAKPDPVEMPADDPLIKRMTALMKKNEKIRFVPTPAAKKKLDALDEKYPNMTREQLKQIKVPVMVVSGDHDLIAIEHTIDLFTHLPHAQLFVVPDASHSCLREKPELLNPQVIKFFKTPYRDFDRMYSIKLRKKIYG